MFYFILQNTFLTQASFLRVPTILYSSMTFCSPLIKTGISLFQVATVPVPFVALVGFYFFFSYEGTLFGCSTFFADSITSIHSSSEWHAWTPVKTGRKPLVLCDQSSQGSSCDCFTERSRPALVHGQTRPSAQNAFTDTNYHSETVWTAAAAAWFFCLQRSDGGEAGLV